MPKKLYQTVENRDNADEVEQQGPYRCDIIFGIPILN